MPALEYRLAGLSSSAVLDLAALGPAVDPATMQLDDRFGAVVVTAADLVALLRRADDGGRLLAHNLAAHLVPGGLLLVVGPQGAAGTFAAACAHSGLELLGDDGPATLPSTTWRRTERFTVHDLVADARQTLRRVDPVELHQALTAGEQLTVLDTRTEVDRARTGCIAGAAHAPRTVLEWLVDPAAGFSQLELAGMDRRLVVVCNGGYSSSLAAANLQRLGFVNATDLRGGMTAWLAAGLPVVDADHSHLDPYVPARSETGTAQKP